jgi:arylsulfatase B/arylsulfatase I/J
MQISVLAAGFGLAAAATAAPHIMHIVADDVGHNDLGYMNADMLTPKIDALAKGGVTMERFYTFKECGPSRGSLLTGRYPFHFGYYRNPSDEGGVSTDYTLLPQVLATVGYKSYAIGKWQRPRATPCTCVQRLCSRRHVCIVSHRSLLYHLGFCNAYRHRQMVSISPDPQMHVESQGK